MNRPDASAAKPKASPATSRLALAWTSLRAMVQDHALLAVLEVQRASISLVKMVAAAIIVSILLVSAWMGLIAAAVVWAVGAGASWGIAILVAALANIAVAVGIGLWAKSQIPDLLFSATLRQLRKDKDAPAPESHDVKTETVA